MHSIKIIGILFLLALVAVFTFQNTAVAQVRFFMWTTSLSVSLMLLSSLFSGIVIGLLLSYLNIWRKKRRGGDAGLPGASFPEAH